MCTDGEKFFEDLCKKKGYNYKKIPTTPEHKTPDYKVTVNGKIFYAEVKDLSDNDDSEEFRKEVNKNHGRVVVWDATNKDNFVKRMINSASKQLKIYKDKPSLIVIYFASSHRMDAEHIIRSVISDKKITIPNNVRSILIIKNINEVSSLPEYELHHNPKAAISFPSGIF